MDQQEKDNLLHQARVGLGKIIEIIKQKRQETIQSIESMKDKIFKLPPSEVLVQNAVVKSFSKRAKDLEAMQPSPYFVKCEVRFDGEELSRFFYFSKFSYPEEHIYSWVSPAASLRFEKPGNFAYQVGEFGNKSGTLIAKEQYMIAGGQILFMAAESLSQPRELVYQEYFSQRKSSFLLPEIVEQMEKAQDKVIRASPEGSFLISGPAGSGKTTLALHRVAYLVQSPDTAERFVEQEIIVFVQDAGTQAYFGGLLPQLGIHNVTITTFADWVRQQLGLYEFAVVTRFGSNEQERDVYEYEKFQALKIIGNTRYNLDVYEILAKTYGPYFSSQSQNVFQNQIKQRVLDRFDLTLLMQAYLSTNHGLFHEETEFKQLKGGKIKRTKIRTPVRYSLMVVDEVQNYLPQQINILRNCLNAPYRALLYVGDLAQQTRLCTIRDWEQVGELFEQDRQAVLQKNYRSTRQILEYINTAGFTVTVPAGVKEGPRVQEVKVIEKEDEIALVKQVVIANPAVVVGVLAKTEEYLTDYHAAFKEYAHVHVLTINEAQGVEFDVLCVVGVNKSLFSASHISQVELATERDRVNHDLLYVALTRAMNELYVFGDSTVQDLVK